VPDRFQFDRSLAEESPVKLLLHPGGALFMLAALAFLVWLVAPALPLIGGIIKLAAFCTMVFGVVGGVFLTFMVNKAESPS
jgi:membrane associated rhomboid family serine protease